MYVKGLSNTKSTDLLLSMAVLVTGLFITSMLQLPQAAHSQEDFEEYLKVQTNNVQKLNQKNIGSGNSTNINCAENLVSSATNAVCSIVETEPDPDPDPDPDPEPGTPTIDIISVHCTDGVTVLFTVSGVEHDSEELTYRIMLLSSEGIRAEGDITIPANAPNPATTSTGFPFVPLPTEEEEYTILAIIGDDLITETFVAPSCPE
ncbi:hypothetical protein BH18THE2_BH18THE2_41510 [soil metagenome]